MNNISIIGPGLLGGSVALASKKFEIADRISLWVRRPAAVEELMDANIAEIVSNDFNEVIPDSDLIVLATPVGAVGEILSKIIPIAKSNAIITDLCSVKKCVVALVDKLLSNSNREDLNFVGAHPMAGAEVGGFINARADLFSGSVCAITPGITSSENSEAVVYKFWEELGCRCIKIDASMHDEMVAKVSHLPHLISSALAITSLDDKSDDVKLAGPGIKGMTRVALGSPDMWAEILLQNKDSVEKVLSEHIDSISEVLKHLKDGQHEEILKFLNKARENRINCFSSD